MKNQQLNENISKEIISGCNSCRTPIYQGDFIYIFEGDKEIGQPR
jgi:hypothetical protein